MKTETLSRIADYLGNGGFFNPEAMEHGKVRDLIMDCRTCIQAQPTFSRVWSMPNKDTFSIPPIGQFVQRYLSHAAFSVDPFARNKRWATHTNDINPSTTAEHHMDAVEFLKMLNTGGARRFDLAILDPPYSPRQISECYKESGIKCGMAETQNAALYSRVKSALVELLSPDAIVLSFGWNSAGMGQKHGFDIIEIMLCCHGAAHNDTVCMAERRRPALL